MSSCNYVATCMSSCTIVATARRLPSTVRVLATYFIGKHTFINISSVCSCIHVFMYIRDTRKLKTDREKENEYACVFVSEGVFMSMRMTARHRKRRRDRETQREAERERETEGDRDIQRETGRKGGREKNNLKTSATIG